MLAFTSGLFGHDKEKAVRFMNPQGFKLRNPLNPAAENPWVFIRLPEFAVATNDMVWLPFRDREMPLGRLAKDYSKRAEDWLEPFKRRGVMRELSHSTAAITFHSIFDHHYHPQR